MENIIDYGKWDCPKGWSELTLKQFQEIERYYSDKDKEFDTRDVLSILCGKSVDEVNSLPYEFTEKIVNQLSWLADTPKYDEPTNKLIIDGITYQANTQEKLKTGEYCAFDTLVKQDKHNYAAMLAILCRKEGEQYDSKFENEILPSRIKMFENLPMMEAMRVVAFFFELWAKSNQLTHLYMAVQEALDLTQSRIETSRKNGDLSALSTILLKRKLKKLRKSMQAISTTSYNS